MTNALTAHVSPASPTVHAGDPLSITLTVTNASNTQARYTYLPTACGLSLVPSSEVCAQRTQYVMVPAQNTSSVTLPVNTDGAKPGTYHLEVGEQILTVTVSK